MSKEIEFIGKLIAFYDNEGIYDEFDKDMNKMVTSSAVRKLMEEGRDLLPKRLPPREAATAMDNMADVDRDRLIANSGGKVIDLRAEFAKRNATNGGNRQALIDLVNGLEQGDLDMEVYNRARLIRDLELNKEVKDEELQTEV